jgi:hypothetical protein
MLKNKKHQILLISIIEFPLAPMGVLAPGTAHARPLTQHPIDTSGNFSVQCLGGGGGKTFEKFKSHARFQNPMITLSGRKVTTSERREKAPFIVHTSFRDSARKPLRQKSMFFVNINLFSTKCWAPSILLLIWNIRLFLYKKKL